MTTPTGTKRIPAREQFLFDLMVTACEGGIGYWCFLLGYNIWMPGPKEPLRENHHAKLRIYDWYAACGEVQDTTMTDWKKLANIDVERLLPQHLHDLNIDVMARGLRVAWDSGWTHAGLAAADRTNGHDGDWDAYDADCIVQFGTLGRVVYG